MKLLKTIIISLAIAGSGLAVFIGSGGDDLGFWNRFGSVNKGYLFHSFAMFGLVLLLAPLIDKYLRYMKQREDERIKQEFIKDFEDGKAKRHPPKGK